MMVLTDGQDYCCGHLKIHLRVLQQFHQGSGALGFRIDCSAPLSCSGRKGNIGRRSVIVLPGQNTCKKHVDDDGGHGA